MANRESWGAVLFLAALLAGAIFLFSGLYAPGPERAGVLLPQRSAAYVTRLSRDLGRSAPGISGQAEAVRPTPLLDAVQEKIAAAEPAANSLLDRNHLFIQLYGAAQRLTQRQVVDDADPRYSVVRLTDGTLTFVNAEEADTASHGKALARLRDQLGKRDIPLLYLQAPGKVAPEDDRLPAGVTDHSNDYADALLAELEVQGVDYVDFRDLFAAMEDRDWSSWFFATDHHWTPEAAFTACGALFELLASDYGYSTPAKYSDPSQFTVEAWEDWFLGSLGKRVGTLYGGVDGIELWKPVFETDFTYSVPIYEIERTGPFEESLLFPERLEEKDYFDSNPYTLYAGGDYPLARIYNHTDEDGPRILLLRDSYACAMTPFLALGCSELITVDLRYFHENLLTYVDWLKPDLVLVLYTTGSVAQDALFEFLPTPAADPAESGPPAVQRPLPAGAGAAAEHQKSD